SLGSALESRRRCFVVETRVGALLVVVPHPWSQGGGACGRRPIRPDKGPLALECLDEALRLAVRPRCVRARAKVPQARGVTRHPQRPRRVATAVIAHHSTRGDAPQTQASARWRNAPQLVPSWSASTST